MRNVVPAAALLFLAACASAGGGIEPAIRIGDMKVPEALTPVATQFSTVLLIEISNPSKETLTVDRIQLGSVSIGTFSVDPVVDRPQRAIGPGATELFEVWTQVRVVASTPSEGLDPIFLRGSVDFVTAKGAFRRPFAKQVNPSTLR
jgi:hypothetical protein